MFFFFAPYVVFIRLFYIFSSLLTINFCLKSDYLYPILHIVYFTLHTAVLVPDVCVPTCVRLRLLILPLGRESVLWQLKADPLRTLTRFSAIKRDFLLHEIDPSL